MESRHSIVCDPSNDAIEPDKQNYKNLFRLSMRFGDKILFRNTNN
jgi:hypothetical protein